MERLFSVTTARFHMRDPHIYVLMGYFPGESNSIAGKRMTACLDGQELPMRAQAEEGFAIRQKYARLGVGPELVDREYRLWILLPEGYEKGRKLRVYQQQDGKRRCVFRIGTGKLQKRRRIPDGYLEGCREEDGRLILRGWAAGFSPCRLQVLDERGKKQKLQTSWHLRPDILQDYPELCPGNPFEPFPERAGTEKARLGGEAPEYADGFGLPGGPDTEEAGKRPDEWLGFEAAFLKPEGNRIRLVIGAAGQSVSYPAQLRRLLENSGGERASYYEQIRRYLRRNGFRRTVLHCARKLKHRYGQRGINYSRWRRSRLPGREELEAQRRATFLHQPLVSIVVPLFRTRPEYLRALVESVEKQTYANWELCLSEGSGPECALREYLEGLSLREPRVRVVFSEKPLGISENTNAALAIAKGDYIAFADHDDLLEETALYECVKLLNEEPEAELVYSDEDKVTMDGKQYFDPHFKSDYNPDLLCSMNYFCHLVLVKRSLQRQAGLLNPAYDGAQDYDFVLRCSELAKKICHVPKVLYHWRAHRESTAEDPQSKAYAFEAGRRAVQAHYDRMGIEARVLAGEYPGLYRTVYGIPEPEPLISVLIPNKDHTEDLDRCLRSLWEENSYRALEIIIIENNSTEEKTFAYYQAVQMAHPNVRVVRWEREFHYAAINNFGVQYANGDYLLFLNNDTKLRSRDCLKELLGPCLRDEVGAAGARLYYGDGTIQHAGVVIGIGGIAGHAFVGSPGSDNGYFSRILCAADVSAVTAACMLVKRSVFEEAGGFDERLAVAFNDIDFCLKVRALGKLVVYSPYAEAWHYESRSRGYEDTPEKIARFNREADEFLRHWPDILKEGDPYYNPNLTLERADFSLKA